MNVFLQEPKPAEIARDVAGTVHAAPAVLAGENEIAALLATAEDREQNRRGMRNVAFGVLAVWLTCLAAGLIVCCFGGPFWIKTVAVLCNLPLYLYSYLFHNKRFRFQYLQKSVGDLLVFPNEPRLLLPLIDSLRTSQTPEWKSAAYPLLTERLWNLPANDAALSLDDTRRATLRAFLSHAHSHKVTENGGFSYLDIDDAATDLAVAAMRTLVQIGDMKTVKVLKKIIRTDAKTPNEAVVRDAISEYLPVLQQKVEEDQAVRERIRSCLSEVVRDPQTMLADFLDTLAPEDANVAFAEFLRVQPARDLPFRAACYAGAGSLGVFGYALLTSGFIRSAGITGATGGAFAMGINVLLSYGRFGNSRQTIQISACELSRRVSDDTRFVALLLKAAKNGLREPEDDAVKKALVRLLHGLEPDDAALVPPPQRAVLRSWLNVPRSEKEAASAAQTLALAALHAVTAIRDTDALPKVEETVRRTAQGTELHEAALRCAGALLSLN